MWGRLAMGAGSAFVVVRLPVDIIGADAVALQGRSVPLA
jgi:hypothetical protein